MITRADDIAASKPSASFAAARAPKGRTGGEGAILGCVGTSARKGFEADLPARLRSGPAEDAAAAAEVSAADELAALESRRSRAPDSSAATSLRNACCFS